MDARIAASIAPIILMTGMEAEKRTLMNSTSIYKPSLIHVGKQVYVMPGFIHDFGDEGHHASLMRTCPRDQDGDYDLRRWRYMPRSWRFDLHEILEQLFLYPFRRWLIDRDGRSIHILNDSILTFIWGLNCGFPLKDVILYTNWVLHGCKPIQVFEKMKNGKYRQIYPMTSF